MKKLLQMRTYPDAVGFVLAAIALLLIPLSWIAAWIMAVIIHEFGHYIALRACGVSVYKVGVKLTGVYMNTSEMSAVEEFVCSLAGPACGLCTLFIADHFPRLAICAIIQTCYNLLPLYPLDGGRGVRCLLQMFCTEESSSRFEKGIRHACFGILFLLAGVATFSLKLGLLPILVALWVFGRNRKLKTPCKEDEQIVQ